MKTEQEILTKALEMAVNNGYRGQSNRWGEGFIKGPGDVVEVEAAIKEWYPDSMFTLRVDGSIDPLYDVNEIIFNKDFARAVWGDKYIPCEDCGGELRKAEAGDISASHICQKCGTKYDATDEEMGNAWRYHLQMMVISEDPIKYLGDNL